MTSNGLDSSRRQANALIAAMHRVVNAGGKVSAQINAALADGPGCWKKKKDAPRIDWGVTKK